jgi:apolipoprotein N-acyltransferase
LLLVAGFALAFDTPLPAAQKILLAGVAVAGVLIATVLRLSRTALLRGVSPLPVLVLFGILAAETPVGVVPELLAGVAGVVIVAWLLDDPMRPPDGLRRGWMIWGIPAVGVGLAWASASLLPSTSAPVGIAGGLLAAALVILAYLVRRPELFDRDAPTTI